MSDDPNEAKSDDTLVPMEPQEDVAEDFHPFDDLTDEYKPSAIKKVFVNELPTQSAPDTQSDIPPLSVETLVCLADTSKFVTRDMWGEIITIHEPSEVERTPNGRYRLLLGGKEVQPIRPQCENYVRQVAQWEFDAQRKVHLRLCSARRTTEGAFMSVRDSALWACTMRRPRDLTSEATIEEFDELKMREGLTRVNYSIFSKDPDNE